MGALAEEYAYPPSLYVVELEYMEAERLLDAAKAAAVYMSAPDAKKLREAAEHLSAQVHSYQGIMP